MASEKATISENIQKYLQKADWKSAIADMEKLFAIDQDPIVRVRIGDARQKLNQKPEAVTEYIHAADLYAEKGFVVKALAQYKLALRIDPASKQAQEKMEGLHSHTTVAENKIEPLEFGTLEPASSVIPLFADMTQEEFNDFIKRMVVHTYPAGKIIIREGESGSSVYVATRGMVGVSTMLQGKKVQLAVLQPSDFFGEIAFLTGKPRTATVEAIEETELLELPEDELQDLISKRPRIRQVLQDRKSTRLNSSHQ